MAQFRPGTGGQPAFLEALLDRELLLATGVPGVYGRGRVFEDIRLRFDELIRLAALPENPEVVRFPPLLPRRQLEDSGYLKSFPHLAGTIFAFDGDERQALEQQETASRHEDWSGFQDMSDLVLTPAACYPVYPAMAARGPLPPGGLMVDAGGAYVFRREPSGDPARMQMFHQRELVRIGEPDVVAAWRDHWRDQAVSLLRSLGLDADAGVAADPFFGRSGRILAASQREQALKFEILVPIAGDEPTAVASFNYHQTHFADAYGLRTSDGEVAHTACLGFGEERVTLALLHKHGFDVESWPEKPRSVLWEAAA